MNRLSSRLALAILCAASATALCAEDQTKAATTPQASSPKEACEKLAEAAKAGNFDAVKQLSADMHGGPGGMHGMHGMHGGKGGKGGAATDAKMKQGFEKMRQEHMAQLKDLKCGSEQVVEDHAVVTAEAKDAKRLVPFVKQGNSWKFDSHTYMSFYRDAMRAMHQQSAGSADTSKSGSSTQSPGDTTKSSS